MLSGVVSIADVMCVLFFSFFSFFSLSTCAISILSCTHTCSITYRRKNWYFLSSVVFHLSSVSFGVIVCRVPCQHHISPQIFLASYNVVIITCHDHAYMYIYIA